jgi:hypothetical protein
MTSIGGINAISTGASSWTSTSSQTTAQPAAPAPTAAATSQPAYSTPIYSIDSSTQSTIIEYRDQTSGVELYQIPTRATLQYERSQRLATAAPRSRPQIAVG